MPATLSDSRKELLDKLLRGGAARPHRIVPRSPVSEVPVSYGQQQIWLHSQFSRNVQIYNEPVTVHRLGSFDRDAFERAFSEIVRRHEAWRTILAGMGLS